MTALARARLASLLLMAFAFLALCGGQPVHAEDQKRASDRSWWLVVSPGPDGNEPEGAPEIAPGAAVSLMLRTSGGLLPKGESWTLQSPAFVSDVPVSSTDATTIGKSLKWKIMTTAHIRRDAEPGSYPITVPRLHDANHRPLRTSITVSDSGRGAAAARHTNAPLWVYVSTIGLAAVALYGSAWWLLRRNRRARQSAE
ncbi:hypothetical protein ACIHFE_34225 [Streptomyces sp. NPDC052396]|uniref:hypothetical protein n=1 Tax=Streptomyces sp. NPDC052396 TaxID=3365689 RepID=UPI0037D93168